MLKKITLTFAALLFLSVQLRVSTSAASSGDIISPNPFNRKFQSPKSQEADKKETDERVAENRQENVPDIIQEIRDFLKFADSEEFQEFQQQIRENAGGEYPQSNRIKDSFPLVKQPAVNDLQESVPQPNHANPPVLVNACLVKLAYVVLTVIAFSVLRAQRKRRNTGV